MRTPCYYVSCNKQWVYCCQKFQGNALLVTQNHYHATKNTLLLCAKLHRTGCYIPSHLFTNGLKYLKTDDSYVLFNHLKINLIKDTCIYMYMYKIYRKQKLYFET